MDTTNTTKLHPLHALYVGQSHGEATTLTFRVQLVREGVPAANGPATTDHRAAGLAAGLGLAIALAAAHLDGNPNGER